MTYLLGSHHVTLSVAGAQEDVDFHTKVLGLRFIKKTVLYDGSIPVYHLYYSNANGDPSSVVTTFPGGIRESSESAELTKLAR
ncbi:VOC family protein [Nesterenkonia pannonica]|uniref:VOC family protein n=1 Tax=Nesterenkonia pannonica TaxID=1548602 RepID=UPI0021647227|nr:VOC family protein [Nesterenkonia pannonica]